MIVSLRTPVGDIVAKQPRTGAVFERHSIDYCCEGDETLEAVCVRASVDPAVVLEQVARASSEALVERDWTGAPLTELTGHIVSVHHVFLRQALSAVASRLERLAAGARPAEIGDRERLRARFDAWRAAVEPHLLFEEQHLFPAIARAVEARDARRRPSPGPTPLGDDIARLAGDHRVIDASLRDLSTTAARVLALEPGVPAILGELAALEADVHRHLHLENNILFPRATALEAAYG
jgi:regulator of cell morphogenesis and NO signaling